MNVETGVGLFLIAGVASLGYLGVRLGELGLAEKNTYELTAKFVSVSGLKQGASVELAGVRVGKVTRIELDPEDYQAEVSLAIDAGIALQEDAIASIRTQGIIGDKFVKITPGGAEELLGAGMEIVETEPAISIEELISKYIFENED
jgi:phospholipid/cholesterol/gamma-HCH transport system substrate-binding protein